MKKLMFTLVLAMAAMSCGQPASHDTAVNDGSSWLMRDSQAQFCVQELRRRSMIPPNLPISLYPDNVNIYMIRQTNPAQYSATESEFKGLCASVGIPIGQAPDQGPR